MESVMLLTTVALGSLLPPRNNPRRLLDQTQIAGLAQSIRVDGLLQNLVVRPEGEGQYRVLAGKRRFLALQLLKKQGAIDVAYQVPVDIRDGLDDQDATRLATVENVQREQLHPLDEGEAVAKLLQLGGTIEAITEKTGLSASTVKRRLALASLAPEAKKAFRAGSFNRGIAEALTLGSREQQRAVLESLQSDAPPDADDIRDMFLGQKPTVAMAIFPRERYTGTLTTDLFAEEEATYFDDVDQFLALQDAAVNAFAQERRQTAAWVDVLHLYTVPWWQFREAGGEEPSGVVINLHPSGTVEIREGLVRHAVDELVNRATCISPMTPRPVRERPAYGPELLRYAACQRSAAVQAALLANPRKAKEAAVELLLVGFRRDFGIRLTVHACHAVPSDERDQAGHRAIAEAITRSLHHLAFPHDGVEPAHQGIVTRLTDGPDFLDVQNAVRRLPDEELDTLLVLLPTLCLGQDHLETVDEGDTVFNLVASDVGVAVRRWWRPDAAFFALLKREQLLQVAADSGAATQLTGMNGWTKGRLVEELATYFANHTDPNKEADRSALTWLPGLLQFPAKKAITLQQS